MDVINKKLWEGIYRKIISLSMASLILSIAIVGVFAPSEKLLQANGDPVAPAVGDVIINEVMWAGNLGEPKDQWIELKNASSGPVNLKGCKLKFYKGSTGNENQIASFSADTIINPSNYYLVSHYKQVNSHIGINNDFSGASNFTYDKFQIKLYCPDESGNPVKIDEVGDALNPPVFGDNGNPKKSMKKCGDEWQTASNIEGGTAYNWDDAAEEKGTPGLANVCEEIICQSNEISRECVSDGFAGVTYEWSDPSCGNNYTEAEEDASCACVETEIIRECADETNRQFTYTYNYDYCAARDPETRADATCGGEPECINEETRSCYSGLEGTAGAGICQAGTQTCIEGGWSECSGEITPQTEICGNGIDEDCNGSDASCGDSTSARMSGGGGFVGGLAISGESIRSSEVSKINIKITWTTSQFSTSQVIYDTEPGKFDSDAGAPNYGYAYSKEGDDSGLEKATGHSVTLTGLNPAMTYYYRAVSSASPPVFSPEKSFVTLAAEETGDIKREEKGEVKGATDMPAPASVPMPEESCNYLSEYIKLGADNNPAEVEKLERFLNEFEGESLAVNGIYEKIDFDAVSRFQKKYSEKVLAPWNHKRSTGYVYITTKKRINELYCEREFPLMPEQEAEIARFSGMLGALVSGAKMPLVGDVTAGASSEEQSEEPNEEIGGVSQEQKEGEVAGAKDEAGDEIREEDKEGGAKEDEEEIVNAYSGYSAYYPWVIFILLFLIIAAIYYLTNIRRKQEKIE